MKGIAVDALSEWQPSLSSEAKDRTALSRNEDRHMIDLGSVASPTSTLTISRVK